MSRLLALFACVLGPVSAFGPVAVRRQGISADHHCTRRSLAQPCMTVAAAEDATLLQLLEQRRLGQFFQAAASEPPAVLELLKDAGFGGAIAYFIVAFGFYVVAASVGEVSYHAASGTWLDPRVLLLSDGADGKAETLAALASFYLLCKPFAPVRLGGALLLAPTVKRYIEERPALVSFIGTVGEVWSSSFGRVLDAASAPLRRVALKDELLELAAACRGGIDALDEKEQARLDEIVTALLPALNPTPDPARSALFSGEWECRWTTEAELNFAVDKGLFGLPWQRTYQTIDVASRVLTNVIQFDEGALTVGSSIEPDESEGAGARFNFAFSQCSLRYKGLTVPLPPVGRGWGELLYLDDTLRIQRDVRGDLLVAERVEPTDE
jgi:hypothetical protein